MRINSKRARTLIARSAMHENSSIQEGWREHNHGRTADQEKKKDEGVRSLVGKRWVWSWDLKEARTGVCQTPRLKVFQTEGSEAEGKKGHRQ